MIQYSYEKLWLLSFGNAEVLVKAFKKLYDGEPGYEVLKGDDFIVNPSVIIDNPYRLTYQQLAEYLGILALRPLIHFKQFGYTDLDMARVPSWVSASIVKTNPLIVINQSKLIFKEENIICQD
ncbi:hypothetical protein [Vibrio phage VCPH]|nr:hypothetical protein [Vibrio phage VCPH]